MLARAPRASWEASIPARSTSVRTSPFRTTSRPAVSAAAFLTPPAVPSGSAPTARVPAGQDAAVQAPQPARRQRGGVLDPAGRPERLRLHGVAEPHAELPPVPEPRLDGPAREGAGPGGGHPAR